MRSRLRNTQEAIQNRNKSWQNHHLIPSWVDLNKVDLDQFFTRLEVAKYCYSLLNDHMVNDGAIPADYIYVEPAAGSCTFFNILPEDRRIGVDILPMQDGLIEHDFLTWLPDNIRRNHAIIGNPPFGYRAWLALAFINHAATFADYVGFILPMAFQSEGKGSPKLRVRGLSLVHSECLPADSFTDLNGAPKKVNALWQIWKRGVNNIAVSPSCESWIDLFTVDMRKERLCGQKRLNEADYFIQRTFYNDPPSLVSDFSHVRYVCGYGIVFQRNADQLFDVLSQTDWKSYSNLAAHNCRHISMYHIRKAVTDAGFIDV